MKNEIRFFLIFLFNVSFTSYSQEIVGTVKDINGNSLPFVSIWCKDHSRGVSANENGDYKLNTKSGIHHLEFRMIGFQTVYEKVRLDENQIFKKDIVLNPIEYNLDNVEIKAFKEDPAIWIMKKAVAMAPFHLNSIESYDFTHYLKFKLIVDTVKGVLSKSYYKELQEDTIRKGKLPGNILFLSETVEKVNFSKPNNFKREIIGAKNSNTGFFRFDSTNHLLALDLNIYREKIANVFSPLHPNAFNLYNFEYENSFKNNDELIHRIKVTPKKKSSEYFNGFIDITDNESMVVSIQLDTKINIVDIKLTIDFLRLKGIYVPVKSFFYGEITFFGSMGKLLYLDEIKNMNLRIDEDYKIQPKLFDERIYKDRAKEMRSNKFDNKENSKKILNDDLSIDKLNEGFDYLRKSNSNQFLPNKFVLEFRRDTSLMKRGQKFWEEYRGNLVDSIELESYALNDTIYHKTREKRTKDSLNYYSNKFKMNQLLNGRNYKYPNSQLILRKLKSEITAVDHYYLKSGIRYEINSKSNKSLVYYFDTGLRYSYGQNFTGFSQFIGIKHSEMNDYFQIGLGDNISPFYDNFSMEYNPSARIKIYSVSDNYYYRKRFINTNVSKTLSNHLVLSSGFEWRNRIDLDNSINYFPLIKIPLNSNNKENREIKTNFSQYDNHYQTLFFIGLNYYLNYHENKINGKKYLDHRDSPSFYFNYYQAGQNGDFQKFRIGFQTYLEATELGNFHLDIQYNHFIKSPTYWLDYHHFNVNNRYFAFYDSENYRSGDFQFFHLKPFYFDSKENLFLGKLEWRPRKFLITQFDFLNLLNVHELLKYSFIRQFGRFNEYYSEISYGINKNFGPISGIQISYPFSKLVEQKLKVQLTLSF